MPIKNYSVLKGTATEFALDDDDSPHFEIRIEAAGKSFRIAVNVRSSIHPHDLLFLKADDFNHPMTKQLLALSNGLHPLEGSGLELDYVHGKLLKKADMSIAPYQLAGTKNDLREYVEPIIKNNLNNQEVSFLAFGEPWGPDSGEDKYFGFSPKRGIHNIHMNQGSQGRFKSSNGPRQDGALFVYFHTENRWTAFFFAFQSQSWVTDQQTGHALTDTLPPRIPAAVKLGSIRIIAALINPPNPEEGKESITLLNRSDADIDLSGWYISDSKNRKFSLSGVIQAGKVMQIGIGISQPIILSNKGGVIELNDMDGVVADSVSYNKQESQQEGWTVLF